MSNHLLNGNVNTSILAANLTGHSLITLTMMKGETELRGKRFWKFNSSHLKDKEYVELINNTTENVENTYQYFEDKNLIWDCLKPEIRNVIISHSIKKNTKEMNLKNYC